MKYLIYKHTSPSGKVYIGITHHKDPNKRWRAGHGYRDSVAFYNAILKYGWINFKHEIIAKELDESEAKKLEIELISKYKKSERYNISRGGESAWGLKHSPETKLKIGKSCSLNRWVNKDGVEMVIKVHELDKYISEGWKHGHLHNAAKNRITINKNGIIKRIQPTDLDKYISEGWKRGLGESVAKHMAASSRGCLWVNQDGIIKRIQPTDLDKYISEGWKPGRGKIGSYRR